MTEITKEDIETLERIKAYNLNKDPLILEHCILNIKLAKAVRELQERGT